MDQVFFEAGKKFLVVEIAAKNSEVFMLRQNPSPRSLTDQSRDSPEARLAIFSKCNYCAQLGKLYFNCQCHKVNYCSKECQLSDVKYHEEKCQGLEVIEKWD